MRERHRDIEGKIKGRPLTTGIPKRGSRFSRQWREEIFEEITADDFPELLKTMNRVVTES